MIRPRSLRQAFAFAFAGLGHAVRTQRTFRVHLGIAAGIGVLLVWLRLPALDSAVIVLAIFLVLVVELINTSVEFVVDLLVERNHHALAKAAKDVAAAAVVLAAAVAVLVGILLMGPPLGRALGVEAAAAARWSWIAAALAVIGGFTGLLRLAGTPSPSGRASSSRHAR